jgi:adenosylcobinamide hydrolase
MTQPFRSAGKLMYACECWPELELHYQEDHIRISGAGLFSCISSAVYNGGVYSADTFVNWKVPLSYQCSDPASDMRAFLSGQKYPVHCTIGLITAAKLTHASIMEEAGDQFKLAVCTTAGTRNAARSGLMRRTYPSYRAGTINTVVCIDGKMTEAAMVNAVMTAAEAKAAALQTLGILDPETGQAATGTTSDAIIIGVNHNSTYNVIHEYAGSAASIGNAVGRLVYASVIEAAETQHEA